MRFLYYFICLAVWDVKPKVHGAAAVGSGQLRLIPTALQIVNGRGAGVVP